MKFKKSIFVYFFIPSLLFPILDFKSAIKLAEGKDKNSVQDFFQLLIIALTKVEYSKEVEDFHQFIKDSIDKFEIKKLYESKYLIDLGENRKSITYLGKVLKDKIFIELNKSKQAQKNFGDFFSKLEINKNEYSRLSKSTYKNSNTYSLDLEIDQNFGVFSHEKAMVLFHELLKVIQIENIQISEKESGIFPNLKSSEEKKLISLVENDFLDLLKFFKKFFQLDQIFKIKEQVLEFHIKGKMLPKNISREFPDFGNYLDTISDLGEIHLVFQNKFGTLGEVHLLSEDLSLEAIFFTSKNLILPYNKKNNQIELNFKDGLSFQNLKNYDFEIKASFIAKIYGLYIENDQILISSNFQNKTNFGKLDFQLKEINRTKVSGGFSYIIPAWAIDLVIPGNMEDLIYDFTKVLKDANGKGSFINLSFTKPKTNWVMNFNFKTEVLDNFFIRFGLKVFNYKIKPSKDEGEDLVKFLVKVLSILKEASR